MKKTIFALAAGILAMSVSAASAMPAAARHAADNTRVAASTDVEPAQYRHHKRSWKHRHYRHRGHAWNDRRYGQYRGWKRHYSRPYSWRSRGCVAVGPIWFCP